MFLAAACATARRFNPIRSVSAFTSAPTFGSALRKDASSSSFITSNNPVNTRNIIFRMSSSDTETDIEGQIKAKGDEIRAMKESGADKKSVAPFVEELLALKAKLELAEIEDQIQAKGDEIRAMKESGADKKTVAPFVEELLALKAKLEPPKKEKKKNSCCE